MKRKRKKTFWKYVYRVVDKLLPDNNIPFLRKWVNKIRRFFGRRICKKIGPGVSISKGCLLYEDVVIEKGSSLSNKVRLGQNTFIGEYSFIAADVYVSTDNHIRTIDGYFASSHDIEWGKVVIGNGCWIGTRAIILNNVVIGDNVTIGAGAVVTKSVPSDCLAAGNPAIVKKCYVKRK